MPDYNLLPIHQELLRTLVEDHQRNPGSAYSFVMIEGQAGYNSWKVEQFSWNDHRDFSLDPKFKPEHFRKLVDEGLLDRPGHKITYEINERGIEAVKRDFIMSTDLSSGTSIKHYSRMQLLGFGVGYLALILILVLSGLSFVSNQGLVPAIAFLSALATLVVTWLQIGIPDEIIKFKVMLWPVVVIFAVVVTLVAFAVIRFWPSGKTKIITYPDVSLLSLRFLSEDYNPRLIDFRTAGVDGVPIRKGVSLKLEDLWVWSTESSSEYSVIAGVYAYPGGKYIGTSEKQLFLREGAFELGNIKPFSYEHGEVENAWTVQEDWDHLTVELVLYKSGKPVKTTATTISINPEGTSWLWDTPQAQIIFVTYSINDEPPLALDLRAATSQGINSKPGDTITLHEVWYKADSSSGRHQINVGGYLTNSDRGYDEQSDQYVSAYTVQSGVNEFVGLEPLSWQVRPNDAFWTLSLARPDDRTLLDRYLIPLNTESQ